MKKLLVATSLVLGISGSVYSAMPTVFAGCFSKKECAEIEGKGHLKTIYQRLINGELITLIEGNESVTIHGTTNGITTVSCSGGCEISQSWFGGVNHVCDSEGVCVEIGGTVKPINQSTISN